MVLSSQLSDQKDVGRARAWCFTFNLGITRDQADLDTGKLWVEGIVASKQISSNKAVARFICQLEAAPTTGMLHLQGFVQFYHARTMSAVRDWLVLCHWKNAHIEKSRGTPLQAWDYCQKEDTRVLGPWTHGDRPAGAGARADLAAFVKDAALLSSGDVKLSELQDTHFSIEARHMRYFDRVVARARPKRDFQTACVVFYGDSGTGKSHIARALCARAETEPYYLRLPETKTAQLFWEQYNSEEVVIVDEMGPGKMQYGEFNSIIDKRPHLVNVKGASAPFLSLLVIFTSNHHPDMWFTDDERIRQTVRRRINLLCRFTHDPDHLPNSTFSNVDEVRENAEIVTVKDDGVVPSSNFFDY